MVAVMVKVQNGTEHKFMIHTVRVCFKLPGWCGDVICHGCFVFLYLREVYNGRSRNAHSSPKSRSEKRWRDKKERPRICSPEEGMQRQTPATPLANRLVSFRKQRASRHFEFIQNYHASQHFPAIRHLHASYPSLLAMLSQTSR